MRKEIDRVVGNVIKKPMKALLQRVSSAHVAVAGKTISGIKKGLLVFLCAVRGDTGKDLDYMVRKVPALRIFEDEQGKMNLSVMDVIGELLVVSQFTLAANTRKGNRPSFENAEELEKARAMYDASSGGFATRGSRCGPGNSRR
jgi:D-aminoacyl-tRNA deacylase